MLCLCYCVGRLQNSQWDTLWTNTFEYTLLQFIESYFIIFPFRMFKFSSKRKDSAIRTLVAETLVLAKTHGYVEKIEHELEEELQRENTEPPNRILAKWRRNGEKLLKNKYTLLTVALFCVTECALILGELILDLHKVKDVLEAQENAAKVFVESLSNVYPDSVVRDETISNVYKHILESKILWRAKLNQTSLIYENTIPHASDNDTRNKRAADFQQIMQVISYDTSGSAHALNNETYYSRVGTHSHADASHEHSLEEEIAHAFHMASITILSLLVFETILKALCAGAAFFSRKLETFDLCIVLISFVVDLVCMQIMPRYKIQDFVFILAFLLPWRVIRVVNSLVVAVQDHEHFRLKLIYGRKKKIVNSLRESEIKLQLFRAQCNALKRLCFNEGIDEAKIDQILLVEECVVNKAGKSKCKIKIDNSSVILLNDKSDFPRLSPRPSLLNLVDKVGGRRKSMQPQAPPNIDLDLFVNAKDSPKKGILKFRARSNSESGRGTLNSPDDGHCHQICLNDLGAYSSLSTPIVINRKSSLSSPVMANHVRNILNCLEDRINQMNSSCSRVPGGGRGSFDAESIAEEVEEVRPPKRFGRRVHSIDETTEGTLEREFKSVSYASKRRASLQPQRCLDEDDCDIFAVKALRMPSSFIIPSSPNQYNDGGPSTSNNTTVVIEAPEFIPSPHSPRIIPTTIQIDPPSIHSSYSMSSSASSNSNKSNKPTSSETHCLGGTSPYGTVINNKQSPHSPLVVPNAITTSTSSISQELQSFMSFLSDAQKQPQDISHKDCVLVASSLKPKPIRTQSDVENQNNLTPSESSDVYESQSNDAGTRNTSIEELEDDFENSDGILTVFNTDGSVLYGAACQTDLKQTYVKADLSKSPDIDSCMSKASHSKETNGTAGKSSKTSKDGMVCSSVKCSMLDQSDCDLNSDSVTNLLS